MISFDSNGNPQPTGINPISVHEFNTIFVFNVNRTMIYIQYQRYVSDFQNSIAKEFKHWIGGSFTTRKENPSDIDLVNLVNYSNELVTKHLTLLRFLTVGGSKVNYMVDGYFVPIYPKEDPRYIITEGWLKYWYSLFSHDKLNNSKGIIEISMN